MMQRFYHLLHLIGVGLGFSTQEKGSISVAGDWPFLFLKSLLPLSLLLLSHPLKGEEFNGDERVQPKVVVIATGGTIAGGGSSSIDAAYNPAQQSVETILTSLPELASLATIEGIQLCNISSQNMEESIWLELWRVTDSLFSNNLCDGVVVTHGTDTMEESAYFLNLTLKHSNPVVFTGSMRPATSLSADGPFNLFDAVAIAASKESHNRGVMVTMNHYIYSADDVTKGHTTNVTAFRAPNIGPLGYMRGGVPTFYRESLTLHTTSSQFSLKGRERLPKVEIVLSYAFSSAAAIDGIIESGVDGIVIAGVGHGNYNREIAKSMERAHERGIVVVRSSLITEGGVDYSAEEFTPKWPVSHNKSPQKGRILLMLALTESRDPLEIQKFFELY